MKKILLSLSVIAFGVAGIPASGQTSGQVNVSDVEARIEGQRVEISVTVEAEGLNIASNGQVALGFFLSGDRDALTLPGILYCGKERYRYNRRSESLSGGPNPEIYRMYKGVKRNQSHTLDYRISLDYAAWMEHASLGYRIVESDCAGERLTTDQVLIDDLRPETEPEGWYPDPKVYGRMACFIEPEAEPVKRRRGEVTVRFTYPGQSAEAQRLFGENRAEYMKIEELFSPVLNHSLITVDSIGIAGFTSPEGNDRANESLLKRRTEALANALREEYRLDESLLRLHWTADDWETISEQVVRMEIPDKNEVLSVINDQDIDPDAKERILKRIGDGAAWERMAEEIFPSLGRTEVSVAYTIRNLDDNQLRELIFTRPDLLSLEEMYRAAQAFGKENRDYAEAFKTAAKQYPEEEGLVWNNAAAALLQQGRMDEALACLRRTPERAEAYLNLGTYYYILGDLEKAQRCFLRAREAGVGQAEENLRLFMEKRSND